MDYIKLAHLCPNIFLQKKDIESDIWHQEIQFEKNKIYLIEAMSGTGKSSLCSYICGYRNDYAGQLYFDNTDAKKMNVRQWADLRTRHFSHLIQDLRLFPELTAYENIEIKNKLTHHKTESQIMELFDYLGIADKWNSLLGKLSFGQQQRVAMIRALCQPFDFLLADEPVSHLDEHNSTLMADVMLEEARQQGAGIIVTSIGKHMDIHYDKILHL